MKFASEIRYDVASAISQGQRPYQEDALITDFALGTDIGFTVLADGMGGHAAGDVASKIVVTEVFSELKLQSGDQKGFRANIPAILRDAALAANDCVKVHVQSNAETAGMGATLLAPVFVSSRLYWISIGDSPLLLFRKGVLRQLNEDHSMAPQIDFMIRSGLLSEEAGRNHPDRSCLTSVLGGEDIPRIDCPAEPFDLQHGDILIAASDGIQYLTFAEIEEVLRAHSSKPARRIAGALLTVLEAHGDPEQDNATFTIVKVLSERSRRLEIAAANESEATMNGTERQYAARAPSSSWLKSTLLTRGAALFRNPTQ
jgi:serine/threonine protein phosphatase PrpC